jgi:hypothetical protein
MSEVPAERDTRMLSVHQFLSKKFNSVKFHGVWADVIGNPQLIGSWIIWGNSSNGKTAGAIQLAKYLCKFESVIYWSIEEGESATLQSAFKRANLTETEAKKIYVPKDGLTFEKLQKKLRKPKSEKIIFIDSLQACAEMYGSGFYYELKKEFGNSKLFVYNSQAEGKHPKGEIGAKCKFDANVKMHCEGFRIQASSRIEGSKAGSFFTVWEKGATEYWGN